MSVIAGVLAFGVVIFVISAIIYRRVDKMERAEIATHIVLIGWGSLLFGLFLAKYTK